MATTDTKNYGLKKAAKTDAYTVDLVNQNLDTTDKIVKDVNDKVESVKTVIGDINFNEIEEYEQSRTVSGYFKHIMKLINGLVKRIKDLKLEDTNVTVVQENKKLDVVIRELKEKDRTQDLDINNKVSESTYNAGVSDINSKISANTNKIDDVKRHVGDVLGTTMYGMGKNNNTAYILDQLDRRIGNLPTLKAYGKSNTSVREFINSADTVDNAQNQAIEKLKNQTKAISDELDGSNARFSELNNELEGYVDRLKRLRG